MRNCLKSRGYEIIFIILSIANLYIFPVIAFYTMSGDKTDIIMGFGFGFVPLGWLIISVFYGALTGKSLFAPSCTMLICLPLFFVRVVTGETMRERVLGMSLVWTVSFLITFLGTFLGRGIRCGIAVLFKKTTYIKEQRR